MATTTITVRELNEALQAFNLLDERDDEVAVSLRENIEHMLSTGKSSVEVMDTAFVRSIKRLSRHYKYYQRVHGSGRR